MYEYWRNRKVMEKVKDGGKGGGGGGNDDPPANDHAEEIAELKKQNADLIARFDKLESGKKGKKKPKPEDDDDVDDEDDDDDKEDLTTKAKKAREQSDKNKNDSRALETALKFSMNAEKWLKDNESVLPKDIAGIFKAAEKENYESAIEKDAAIKAGIIQAFFSVQANLDLLTPAIKVQLEDWQKLTKTGKQERARDIYDIVFEPSFEMLKAVKKAQALNKNGQKNSTEGEDNYKNKMVAGSRKHYLGKES